MIQDKNMVSSLQWIIFFLVSVYLPQQTLAVLGGSSVCALQRTSAPAATTQRAACHPGGICPATERGLWHWFRDIPYGISWQAVLTVTLPLAPGKEMEGWSHQRHTRPFSSHSSGEKLRQLIWDEKVLVWCKWQRRKEEDIWN